MNIKRVTCHLVTSITLLVVVTFATRGEFFLNLVEYPSDIFVFFALLLLGYFLTLKVSKSSKNVSFFNIALVSLFYYFAYCVFSDGYLAGWSHSTSITDKLFVGILISFMNFLVVFPPLIAILVATIHNLVLSRLSVPN